MNERATPKASKAQRNARASGAKPRPEGRVREHAFAADAHSFALRRGFKEAARPRATEQRPTNGTSHARTYAEAAMSERASAN